MISFKNTLDYKLEQIKILNYKSLQNQKIRIGQLLIENSFLNNKLIFLFVQKPIQYCLLPVQYIVMNFREKRQQISKMIRRQHLDDLFSSKRSKFTDQVQTKVNPQKLQLNTNTQEESIDLLRSLPPYIKCLDNQTLTLAYQLSKFHMQQQYLQGPATSCLVELTSLRQIEEPLKIKLYQIIPNVIKILKGTKDIEVMLNCLYIYGNIINERSLQKIEENIEILEILRKVWEKSPIYADLWESILWLIRNTLLTYIYLPGQHKNTACKSYGQYSLEICHSFIGSALTMERKYKEQNNRTMILNCLSLMRLVIAHNYYIDEILLNQVNDNMMKVAELLREDNIIMEQIVQLSYVMIKIMGLTQAISQLVVQIINLKINAVNGMILCCLINQIGCYKLQNYDQSIKNISQFITMMNRDILKNQQSIFNNPQTIIQQNSRQNLIRYILSYNQSLKVINMIYILNILELGLIDQEITNVEDALKIIQLLVQQCQQVGILNNLVEMLEETSICKTLSDLQMNVNASIYDKATNILHKLNDQQDTIDY